jgi:hypothetical protein
MQGAPAGRPIGQVPGRSQPPAGVLQGVVQPLALGPLILRTPPLPQRVQHRLHTTAAHCGSDGGTRINLRNPHELRGRI